MAIMSTSRVAVTLLACAASAYAQQSSELAYFNRNQNKFITAHAVVASVTVGLLFPLGAIMIRLARGPKTWLMHGLFQTASYMFFIAAVGLGIFIAKETDQLNDKHPIIGLVLLALFFFEPALGYYHHRSFAKYGDRVAISHIHIWLGRALITLGIINGGFGLQLSQATKAQIIGYSVPAGVVWLIYVASAITGEMRRRKAMSSKLRVKEERDVSEASI